MKQVCKPMFKYMQFHPYKYCHNYWPILYMAQNPQRKKKEKEFSFSIFKYPAAATTEQQVWHHKQTSLCISHAVYCPPVVHKPASHKTHARFITSKSLSMFSVFSKSTLYRDTLSEGHMEMYIYWVQFVTAFGFHRWWKVEQTGVSVWKKPIIWIRKQVLSGRTMNLCVVFSWYMHAFVHSALVSALFWAGCIESRTSPRNTGHGAGIQTGLDASQVHTYSHQLAICLYPVRLLPDFGR